MKYNNGEKIELLDSVATSQGFKGSVVGFDKIGDRQFVLVMNSAGAKFWATANTLTKFKQLIVKKEV